MADCKKCYEDVVAKKVAPSGTYCYHDVEERLGFETVADFDDPEASYSFDEFRIWRRTDDGRLFYGTDSGCSCPSPFQDFKAEADCTAITKQSLSAFVQAFSEYCARRCGWNDNGQRFVEGHIEAETIAKVKKLLNEVKENANAD